MAESDSNELSHNREIQVYTTVTALVDDCELQSIASLTAVYLMAAFVRVLALDSLSVRSMH